MQQRTEPGRNPSPPAPDGGWRPRPGTESKLLFLLGRGEWVPLQTREDRVAYRVDTPDGRLFVKHYKQSQLVGRMRDFLFRRKPQKAFAYGFKLARSGVGTPRPLGLFVVGRGLLREALLINEWLQDEVKWSRHLIQRVPKARFPERFRGAVTALGTLLGRLHRLGLYHGDLSGNLLFAGPGEGSRPYLVDLENLHPRLSRKRRIKNLEELGRSVRDLSVFSLRDRWLLLRTYAAAAGLDLEEARALWRDARSAQLARDARKGHGRGQMP